MNPIDWLIDLLARSWMDSGAKALETALSNLQDAPWPDLTADWFKEFWNSSFALALVIAFVMVIVHSLIFMFRYEHDSVFGAVVNFGKLMLNGTFLLMILFGLMSAVTVLTNLVIEAIKIINAQAIWFTPLVNLDGVSPLGVWFDLGMSYMGMAAGQLLVVQTMITNLCIFVCSIMYLFGGAAGPGLIGKILRSLVGATLLTFISMRLYQVIVLGIFSVALNYSPLPEAAGGIGVFIAIFIAVSFPVLLWILYFFILFKVERRTDARAMAARAQEIREANVSTDQLAQRRVGVVTSMKESVGNAASMATKAAVAGAIALGITKAAAGATKLIGAGTPTPHGKIVAGTAALIEKGARTLEIKARDYVYNKTGRVGSSRARNRSLTR